MFFVADPIGIWRDDETGWRAQGNRSPKVGYYLEDIVHDGHYFADSIRIERVAVAGFSTTSSKYRRDQLSSYQVFGLGDCVEVRAPTLSKLKGRSDPLGYYSPKLRISAGYEMTSLLGEDDQSIELDTSWLFTPYNKDPSHEPGGIISAARVYPTLTFRIPEVRHKKRRDEYRRATAVQVIYRLNFKLEDRGSGNQCGLFADLENLDPVSGMKTAATRHLQPGSFTFVQAEKPVMFDVVGRGIHHGKPLHWSMNLAGWDNIHQWSHPVEKKFDRTEWLEKGVEEQPPTPGLPYGAHLHWRWGAGAVAGGRGLPGGKQYEGFAGPGTPLIDHRIRDQTIEFAIVDRDGWFSDRQEEKLLKAIDQDPVSYLFTDFSNVWEYLTLPPETLMPTGDLVIWLSLTAWSPSFTADLPDYHRSGGSADSVLSEFGGTFFPHGIFFPHQNLDDMARTDQLKIGLIPGGKAAQFLPDVPDQRWRR